MAFSSFTRPVRCGILAVFTAILLAGQDKQPSKQEPTTQEPPEEDVSAVPKEYVLNPVQAQKEFTIGQYYFKKQRYQAAARRFTEATKWNPGYAEAYARLGDAYSKLNDAKDAQEAYKKFLELDPEGKEAASIRKKVK